MADISEVLNKFSKKLSRFEKDSSAVFVKADSPDSSLQKKINASERDRNQKIISEFEKYKTAVSKEIEDDENAVLAALEIHKACVEAEKLQNQNGGNIAVISDLNFKSPLCKKNEYAGAAAQSKLIYLICWLYFVQNEKTYAPQIMKNTAGERCLYFVKFSELNLSSEEKSIFGIIGNGEKG